MGEEEKREGRGEDDDNGDEFSTLSSLVLYTGFLLPLTMVHTSAFGSHNIFVHSYTQAMQDFHIKLNYIFGSNVPITVPA